MINVLYVVDRLGQRSGITSVVMNYLLNIDSSEIHIDVVVGDESEDKYIKKLKENGNKVYIMPRVTLYNLFSNVKWWMLFFREHREYGVIHSHFSQIDAYVFIIAKFYGVKKCISHSHSAALSDSMLKIIRNYLLCYPIRMLADYWGACSELAGRALYGDKFTNSSKKILLYNAINASTFVFNADKRKEIREKYNIDKKFVIGNIGRFYPPKNKMFLLKILKEMIKIEPRVCLLNIGDGIEEKEFIDVMHENALQDYVIMTGLVSNPQDYLQAMDVFVLPSLYEGLPVVGVEAQASGLPCVFSDVITREVDLLEGYNLYLSLDTSVDIWAKEILNLRNNKRGDMSKVLLEKGYEINEEKRRLADFYRSILNE